MMFDDERDILDFARSFMTVSSVLQFNGNSFNKKVLRCLQDESCLTENNGHDDDPPDFYSMSHNMMFDVFRVNDSEKKKSYNPVKMRERDRHREIVQKFGDMLVPEAKIMIASETDDPHDHTYRQYVKNVSRVSGAHIKKIPLWDKTCPSIKYKGFFIFDETEAYYDGVSMPTGSVVPGQEWLRGVDPDGCWHMPWFDRKLVQNLYDAPIDFVAWFCPYKVYGVAVQMGMKYPSLAILDVRYPFNKYVNYSDTLVC